MTSVNTLTFTPILLLFSSFICLLFHKRTTIVSYISIGMMIVIAVCFLGVNYSEFPLNPHRLQIFNFLFSSEHLKSNNSLALDLFSRLTFTCIFVLAAVISLYMIGDKKRDQHLSLYLIFLQLIIGSAFLIFLSNNVFFLCVGLSLSSILSYIIPISTNHTRAPQEKSFLLLRQHLLADLCIIFGLLMFALYRQSLDCSAIFDRNFWNDMMDEASLEHYFKYLPAGWLITSGILVKMAQNPFHNWLASTSSLSIPLQAVLHHGMIVHSGLFLLFKLTPYYSIYGPYSLCFILFGAVNMIYARFQSILTDNIQQVVAYSTSGSVGVILFIYGLGFYNIAYIMFLVHLSLKMCFVLLSDVIIRIMSGEKMLSKMGGLRKPAPLTFLCAGVITAFLLSCWVIADGIGYSEIIDTLYRSKQFILIGVYAFCLVLSGLYLARFILTIFMGKSRAEEHVEAYITEAPLRKLLPLSLGGIFAITLTILLLFAKKITFLEMDAIWIHSSNQLQPVIWIKIAILSSIVLLILLKLKAGYHYAIQKHQSWTNAVSHYCYYQTKKYMTSITVYFQKITHVMTDFTSFYSFKSTEANHDIKTNIYWLEKLFSDKVNINLKGLSGLIMLLFVGLIIYSLTVR